MNNQQIQKNSNKNKTKLYRNNNKLNLFHLIALIIFIILVLYIIIAIINYFVDFIPKKNKILESLFPTRKNED